LIETEKSQLKNGMKTTYNPLLTQQEKEVQEEKTLKLWANSLLVEPKLRNFQDASDGLLILKLVSCIDPDAVDWKQLVTPATSKQDIL
jgi:hypothetical protein